MEAYKSESIQISAMRRELSEIVATAFLSYIVTDLIQSFNVGKTMNDIQVVFVVNAIKSDYWYLKPEELKYCFEQAKKGKYGTMYDRIDAAVIFGWLDKYVEERTQLCYNEQIERNKAYNSGTIHPEVANVLSKAIKSIPTPEPREYKPRERTESEKIVDQIIQEFDLLHREKPLDLNEKIRTIPYLGKNMDINEFILVRMEEYNSL